MRRNEQIRISPVRVIGKENEQLGILPTDEAIRLARDEGMDLVEVAPGVRPPVCRIMDYGKWKYLQKKKSSKSHEQHLKEVRLRPRTDTHDLEIKTRNARAFFEKGHKVQFTMRFRGRERAHREIALAALKHISDAFSDKVKIERPPSMDGRNMVMVLAPVKGAFDKPGEKPADAPDSAERLPSPRPERPAEPGPRAERPAEPDLRAEQPAESGPRPEAGRPARPDDLAAVSAEKAVGGELE
jgi:translation initiation factor IF-3